MSCPSIANETVGLSLSIQRLGHHGGDDFRTPVGDHSVSNHYKFICKCLNAIFDKNLV